MREVPSLAPTSELTDRYELGEPLGYGSTATVFSATHRRTGRQVAVKIFTARSADAPNHRSEAATLSALHHPGLVEIEEVGVHRGDTCLVMRLVPGEALSQRIARGPVPDADVVGIGARLADTLHHVHAHGVVHRDIKPSNVLLDARQAPHLTDFGVSKVVDATRITATGSVVGTPAYMAPEQVRGLGVGPQADVYALGLVLLEALTGRREYPGTVVECAVARLHRDPVVPRELPAGLRALLSAMTAQDPADRPSAATVARRLASPDVAADGVAAGRQGAPVIRRAVWAVAAAAALLIALAAGLANLVSAEPAPAASPPAEQAVPVTAAVPQAAVAPPSPERGSPQVAAVAVIVEAPPRRPVATAEKPAAGAEEKAGGGTATKVGKDKGGKDKGGKGKGGKK